MTTGSDNKNAAGGTDMKASASAARPAEAAAPNTTAQPGVATAGPAAMTTPAPTAAAAAQAARPATANHAAERPRPGPVRRFVRSVVSHVMFAAIITLGVLGYLFHAQILRDVGDKVCAPNMLGQFMSETPTAQPGGEIASRVATGAATAAATPADSAVVLGGGAPVAAKSTAPPPAIETPASRTVASEQPTAVTAPPERPLNQPGLADLSSANSPPELDAAPATPIAAVPVVQSVEPTTVVTAAAPPAAAKKSAASQFAPVEHTGISLATAWQAAREAYVARKPEAVEAYRELAASYPDMPEITGELGNIYYAEKRYAEAGEQYLETAKRLLKQNRAAEAGCMADVLAQIAPDKAQQLRAMTSVPCQRQR